MYIEILITIGVLVGVIVMISTGGYSESDSNVDRDGSEVHSNSDEKLFNNGWSQDADDLSDPAKYSKNYGYWESLDD